MRKESRTVQNDSIDVRKKPRIVGKDSCGVKKQSRNVRQECRIERKKSGL